MKRRPVVVILAVLGSHGGKDVVVAPITHTPPGQGVDGLPIPPRVKKHLGLDDQPSWIIASDLNVFAWPGDDLYPVPKAPPGTYDYGLIPPDLYAELKKRVIANMSVTPPTPR